MDKAATAARIAELKAELAELVAATQDRPDRHRPVHRLTVRRIEEIVRRKVLGFHADGNNLYLDFKSPPGANWVFRYKRDGVAHDLGLGSWTAGVSLAEARALAEDCRKKLRAGGDPLAARRAKRAAQQAERAKAMTFKQCAEAYIAAFQVNWTNPRHRQQWPISLADHVYPTIGALPVAVIDTGLIMRVLEPIWYDKPETARRVRARIELILGWATTSGYRTGENPARWAAHLKNLLPARAEATLDKHHPAMPYAELPGFMARLSQEGAVGMLALRVAILTVLRTNEVLGARWAEFDLDEKVWIVPAERMKMRREHRIPLAELVLEILRKLQRLPPSEFVFAVHPRRPIGPTSMLVSLKRLGRAETVHGFRSTFSDWCAERTNFASDLREMALGHAIGNKVEAAYRRGDLFQKRRQLMDAWAKFATSPASEGNVVPLARRSPPVASKARSA